MSGPLFMVASVGDSVQLTNPGSIDESTTAPTTAEAGYELRSDGQVWAEFGNDPDFKIEDWLLPNGSGAAYECRATLLSGTLDGGSASTGVWLALSTNRKWRCVATSGSQTASITVEIRRGTTVLAETGSFPITADSS